MHCNKVSFQELLDYFDNDIDNILIMFRHKCLFVHISLESVYAIILDLQLLCILSCLYMHTQNWIKEKACAQAYHVHMLIHVIMYTTIEQLSST